MTDQHFNVIGEGSTPARALSDFEYKMFEFMEEHPNATQSHKTVYNKNGKHQVVQHMVVLDGTSTVFERSKKIKRKGFE